MLHNKAIKLYKLKTSHEHYTCTKVQVVSDLHFCYFTILIYFCWFFKNGVFLKIKPKIHLKNLLCSLFKRHDLILIPHINEISSCIIKSHDLDVIPISVIFLSVSSDCVSGEIIPFLLFKLKVTYESIFTQC